MAALTDQPADIVEQHRALARGARVHADRALRAVDSGNLNDWLTLDLVDEGQLAWLATGLLPSAQSKRDTEEIVAAIVGRTAMLLLMAGWQPPADLLPESDGE